MIPIEIENRIAKYFFHMYLPAEIGIKVEYCLLKICDHLDEEALNHDELILLAIRIIDDYWLGKASNNYSSHGRKFLIAIS